MAVAKTRPKLPTVLRDLQRRMKSGYRWERTGGGHYRLRNGHGRFVEHEGKVITSGASPSPGAERALEEQLRAAHVFRGQDKRPYVATRQAKKNRTDALRAMAEARAEIRAGEAKVLRGRLLPIVERAGGTEGTGVLQDFAMVGSLIARERGEGRMTPDRLGHSIRRVMAGAWIEPVYQEVWNQLADRIERAPDPVGEWYSMVREVRGLPAETIEVKLTEGEWPYRLELVPIEALFAEERYQRPVSWFFVRTEAARFSEPLVGTIDVAQRGPSRFAILDGQQRVEMCKLVGKSSVPAAIYTGLDLVSEARFFLHKNRSRKNVHPFYTYQARLTAQDQETVDIERIVRKFGYVVAIGAPSIDERPDNIAAIAALEKAYRRSRNGSRALECLSPTLATLRQSTHGRPQGQSSMMIRGLSLMFERYSDDQLDRDRLTGLIADIGPELLLGRAKDVVRGSGRNGEHALALVLAAEYDRRAGRERRLPKAA